MTVNYDPCMKAACTYTLWQYALLLKDHGTSATALEVIDLESRKTSKVSQ